MKRSAGVTVIAILSLLGSGFTFAMGIVVVAVAFIAPASASNQFPGSPNFFKALLLVSSLIYFVPAVWGIVTGIGLLRLRNWARISIIVFSVLLILMVGFSGLVTLVAPFPPPQNNAVDPAMMTGIRMAIGAFMLALSGIGVWWLVFFNRLKVKEQFGELPPVIADGSPLHAAYPVQSSPAGAADHSAVKRPLSITILAWFLLIGCLFVPLGLVLRTPMILFTKILTGWPAVLVCLGYAGAQAYIGVGLLRLKPAVRTAGIIFYTFGFVNAAVFYFAPGGHARLLALLQTQQSMFPWMRPFMTHPEFQFDPISFLILGTVGGLVGIMLPMYFLITRKFAF